MARNLWSRPGLLAFLLMVALSVAAALPGERGLAQKPEGPPGVSGSAPPSAAPPEASASASAAPPPAAAGPEAEPPPPVTPPPPVDRLRVFILTFSPGDHPFYKFGHNAIWIQDLSVKNPFLRERVYNYGMFSFGDPKLLPKFFLGRFMYWLDVDTFPGTVRTYQRENRNIQAQELDLTFAQKRELQRLLEENVKPENKYYKYDYYRDNCSTRVRDMIDKVTGGRVRAAAAAPARLTYREHTLRLTESYPAEYVILNFVMGDVIDQKVTKWEEAFIPMEFQETLRHVTLLDENGVERPIVKEEKLILPSQQTPPPANPPIWWPYSLAVGALLGGLLAALGRGGVKSPPLRVVFGMLISFFGLLWGFFGLFFLAAWAFTDHQVGYHNENTLLAVPWSIVLVGTGINVMRRRAPSIQRAHLLIKAALISSCAALVLKVLPWFDQANGFFLVFFIPFWAGAFVGIRELHGKLRPLAAEPAAGKPKGDKPSADKPSADKPKGAAKKRDEQPAELASKPKAKPKAEPEPKAEPKPADDDEPAPKPD